MSSSCHWQIISRYTQPINKLILEQFEHTRHESYLLCWLWYCLRQVRLEIVILLHTSLSLHVTKSLLVIKLQMSSKCTRTTRVDERTMTLTHRTRFLHCWLIGSTGNSKWFQIGLVVFFVDGPNCCPFSTTLGRRGI